MKTSFLSSSILRGALPLLAGVFLPTLAQAHPGFPSHTHGFSNGLAHPLSGLDHILAMIAVGLWAAQRGGRALWLVPATFVSIVAVGGILGRVGGGIPCVEPGLAASVLVLGVFIAAAIRLPLTASVAVVGLFALFHGYAHGAEMPATASGLAYGMGFMLATAGLHLGGLSLGLAARRSASMQPVRCAGGAIAACGIYLCFAA